MRMQRLFPTLCGVLGLVLLIACKNKTTPSIDYGTATFPLTAGSWWHYSKTSFFEPFNDTSYADTILFDIVRRIVGPDTLIDSLNLTMVDDSVLTVATQETSVTRWWYGINQSQLKEYGYQIWRPGKPTIPQFYDTPHVLLDLPLWNGKVWTSYVAVLGSMRRHVLRRENISGASRLFNCDAVKSEQIDETGHVVPPTMTEWYCDQGLIASETDYGIRMIYDGWGNIIDSAKSYDRQTLLSLNILSGF